MSTETTVSPVEETQIPATEPAEQVEAEGKPVEAEQPEEKVEETEESKAIKRLQRRIDKRTADVYRERAEKQQLAERLAALERQIQPGTEDQGRPEDVNAKAQQLAKEIAHQERLKESIASVLSAGKGLEGFDAACNAVDEEVPFYDRAGNPTAFLTSILEFDAPAKLLHHIGTHPELAQELADLTPVRRVIKLGDIQRELTAKPVTRISSAPRPLEPVKAKGSDRDPSQMTDKEFAQWRRAQIAKRR